MSELYNRIDSLCKERGTNITALCREAKVARSSLSELNAGRTKTLTLETGSKLAAALGITVDELMGTETEKEPPATRRGSEISDEELKVALWVKVDDIDDDDLADVKRYAAFVKERKKGT